MLALSLSLPVSTTPSFSSFRTSITSISSLRVLLLSLDSCQSLEDSCAIPQFPSSLLPIPSKDACQCSYLFINAIQQAHNSRCWVVTNQGRRSKLKSLSYTSLLLVKYMLSRCFRYRTAMYFLAYQQRTCSFQRRSRRKPTYSYFFPRYSGCLLSFRRRMPSSVFSYITIRQCSKRDIRNFQTMFQRRSSFYVLMQQNLAYCSFILARMVFRSSLNAKFSFQKFLMRCTRASGAFSEALVSAICLRSLDRVLPFPSLAVSLTLSSQIVGICLALSSSSNKYTFVSNQLMYALLLASCAVNSSHFFCRLSLVYLKRGSDSLYFLTEIFFRLSSFIGVANFLIVLSYNDTLFCPRKLLRAEWEVQAGFLIQKPNGSFELLLSSLLFQRSPLPLLLNLFRSLG